MKGIDVIKRNASGEELYTWFCIASHTNVPKQSIESCFDCMHCNPYNVIAWLANSFLILSSLLLL